MLKTISAAFVFSASMAFGSTSFEAATNLGKLLASELPCGLSYNHEAINQWIDTNVSADDMGFPSSLNAMTTGSGYLIESMTPTALSAHCHAVERTARNFGFIE